MNCGGERGGVGNQKASFFIIFKFLPLKNTNLSQIQRKHKICFHCSYEVYVIMKDINIFSKQGFLRGHKKMCPTHTNSLVCPGLRDNYCNIFPPSLLSLYRLIFPFLVKFYYLDCQTPAPSSQRIFQENKSSFNLENH